ncbi:MAG: hypothetical protein E7134_01235 [Rikenellaceae bacterium]|nr:hypothetical protein [Rikenellaceae bacterium]
MSKNKLKVDARVSASVGLLSTVLKVVGWMGLVIFIFIMLRNAEELGGGYYDRPSMFYNGLEGFISSLFVIFSGTIVKGLAIITKSAEMFIATTKENYTVEEKVDDLDMLKE